MADVEDKEKAEKLAAAKKRFEQLKKQKQNQGAKKAGAKKKEAKTEDAADKADDSSEKPEHGNEAEKNVEVEEDAADEEDVQKDTAGEGSDRSEPATPSVAAQSRQRSESFRKTGELKSPTAKTGSLPPIDSEGEVQELYRKQASRIEELEKRVEGLGKVQEKLDKAEIELDKLREGSGDAAALKAKADLADARASEIDKLKAELSSTQRQLTQAQQSAANKNKRASTANPNQELTEQLASKTSTIESLELELSNLRYQISSFEADKSAHEKQVAELEKRAKRAEESAKTAQEGQQKLKDSRTTAMSKPDETAAADVGPLQSKLTALQAELKTSQASLDAANNKTSNLETKVDTLTKLHRESSSQNAAKEKEIKDLKARVKKLSTARSDAAGEDLSDLEDEEREKLHARIRDLEAETFELRRGVWRDKRAAMQPGMDDEAAVSSPPSGHYEDVDLNGSSYFGTPYGTGARPSFGAGAGRQTSTFSDVLQSGISAFTGRENPRAAVVAERKASADLMSDDFDEDAFRAAHEAEAAARIERVKEVKRGLDKWRGWRLDLSEQRQGGVPGFTAGPVFEA